MLSYEFITMSTRWHVRVSLRDAVQMENERLKKQIDAGAMAQPVEEDSMKGLTAQGINLSYMKMQRLAYL